MMLARYWKKFTVWLSPELPTLPTALDSETCVKKGLCPIAVDYSPRPRNIYYEIHGDLNASQKNCSHHGHELYLLGVGTSGGAS